MHPVTAWLACLLLGPWGAMVTVAFVPMLWKDFNVLTAIWTWLIGVFPLWIAVVLVRSLAVRRRGERVFLEPAGSSAMARSTHWVAGLAVATMCFFAAAFAGNLVLVAFQGHPGASPAGFAVALAITVMLVAGAVVGVLALRRRHPAGAASDPGDGVRDSRSGGSGSSP